MQANSDTIIPVLFNVLFGLVALNVIINIVLLVTRRNRTRLNKLLAIYWPVVFLFYLFQGQFNDSSHLVIIMAYSMSYGVSFIKGMIAYEAVGKKFAYKLYLPFLLPFYPITYLFHYLGYGFETVAMPFAIASAVPVAHGAYYLLFGTKNKSTTRIQKILGVIYFFEAFHSINFALFRMEPGAQFLGWIVSYTLCDLMAVMLPAMALEQAAVTEEARLQKLVEERTQALSQTVKMNDTLLKVLIHDISNPLMTMKNYLYLVKSQPERASYLLSKVEKSQNAIDQIFFQIRDLYSKGFANDTDHRVSLDACFKEVAFIFEEKLKNKDVSLRFSNELKPDTFVRANPVALTHNVLSNLISNSLKFAPPHSEIVVTAKEKDSNIILEVKDSGSGIPLSVVQRLNENQEISSTQGTMGETGSGYGLNIVKSFVDSFGGEIEFDSPFVRGYGDYGTKVSITLDRA